MSPAEIHLPSLSAHYRYRVGEVSHLLRPAGTHAVGASEEVKVSARRRILVHTLLTGERIAVTNRSREDGPPNVDGLLRATKRTEPQWLWHRLTNDIAGEIKSRGFAAVSRSIAATWRNNFAFQQEIVDATGTIVRRGLRAPQLGALHAIGSHWSLSNHPATIVMPTGTGKTETMLAALAAYSSGLFLVVVPSEVLRDQTARKFAVFGLLRELQTLQASARNPIVGVIHRRPKTSAELDILGHCNVIVTTMSAIAEGTAEPLRELIALHTDTLIVDEAHHIPAAGWSAFREVFGERRVLQFTATPYRRDGRLVEGAVIFEYPLARAQRDGYFKKIRFEPIYEVDQSDADRAVAVAAVEALRNDIKFGYDHLLMARCDRIERARAVIETYKAIAPELAPQLIHSGSKDNETALARLFSRESRVVVAVKMLGEGFDLPALKVAAVHDTHKSLAILLQFTGRFTRASGPAIGDATIVANIADPQVSAALERLYSEDADWNQLLSELSSGAAKAHAELIAFLNASERLDKADAPDTVEVSHHLLRPMFSTLLYRATTFSPKAFFKALNAATTLHSVWLHQDSKTLYFVTRVEPPVAWTRSREIRDRQWDLFVLHFDEAQQLLYLASSDRESVHQGLATAVGATELVSGETIFRSLGRIHRLVFQNVGVRKYGRRNLRFAMYTGSDVAEALSLSEKKGSVKSNLSGIGWENGERITIGCSYKGRVWTREPGSIPEFTRWCKDVGAKILDDTIDPKDVLANVLIPKEVDSLPAKAILSIEWPWEISHQAEERVVLVRDEAELPLSMFDLEVATIDLEASRINLRVRAMTNELWSELGFTVGGDNGYNVVDTATSQTRIRVGRLERPIAEYLTSYPPLVRFVDLSELDGNVLFEPQTLAASEYPAERLESWDWTGTDVSKESIWKDGVERQESIQWRVAQHYIKSEFAIVFDDDAPGEAGDLVCMKEEASVISLAIVHCKFTKGATSGERVSDVQEVCAQAVRSAKWKGAFADLCRHVITRDKRLATPERPTRFLAGNADLVNRISKKSKTKELRLAVIIAQPGVSKGNHTSDQARVMGAADSYLKETVGIDLAVISGI